jgi:hypothetical protein
VALSDRKFDAVDDFLWSGILGGVPTPLPGDPDEKAIGADQGRLLSWLDAGEKLHLYCQVNHLDSPHIISHSHGLQVVIFASAKGQRFGTVISISGPTRRDMDRAMRAGMGNVEKWVQVVDPVSDMTIREGQAADGRLGWSYDIELPGAINIHTPGTGHSGMTLDVKAWNDHGLFALLDPQRSLDDLA